MPIVDRDIMSRLLLIGTRGAISQSVNNGTDQQVVAGTVGLQTFITSMLVECAVATTITIKFGAATTIMVFHVAANTPIFMSFPFPGIPSINTNQSVTVRHSDAAPQVVSISFTVFKHP